MRRVTSKILQLVLVLKEVASPATNLVKVEEKEKILDQTAMQALKKGENCKSKSKHHKDIAIALL